MRINHWKIQGWSFWHHVVWARGTDNGNRILFPPCDEFTPSDVVENCRNRKWRNETDSKKSSSKFSLRNCSFPYFGDLRFLGLNLPSLPKKFRTPDSPDHLGGLKLLRITLEACQLLRGASCFMAARFARFHGWINERELNRAPLLSSILFFHFNLGWVSNHLPVGTEDEEFCSLFWLHQHWR